MQKLRLDELLRYTLSGALFLIALLLRGPSTQVGPWTSTPGLGEATKALGFVLVFGALIYSVHRAIVFPWLLLPIALTLPTAFRAYEFDRKIWIPFRVSDPERKLDAERFALRAQNDTLFDVWNEWAAQVHFLYCSGQAVFLALIVGHVLGGYNHRGLLLVSAISFLACGLIHHLNLIYRATVVWKPQIAERLVRQGQTPSGQGRDQEPNT